MLERLQLGIERIKEIKEEKKLQKEFQEYFEKVAEFLLLLEETRQWIEKGNMEEASLQMLKEKNEALYADISPENYDLSYANPMFSCKKLGKHGSILSALYAELRGIIPYLYEYNLEAFVGRMEFFLEIYVLFLDEAADHKLPGPEALKEAFYWFAFDFMEDILRNEIASQYDPSHNRTTLFLDKADCNDLRYLYHYGEFISPQVMKLAEYVNKLPEEKVCLMADTYTEGFKKGFEVTGKDISIKKTVNIYYNLGMERVVKKAMKNFREMGLEPILYRAPASFLAGRKLYKSGYHGQAVNRQFEYDHENDESIYFNSRFMNRKLEAYQTVLKEFKEVASYMAGPAVIEAFGESPFTPVLKKENIMPDEKIRKLQLEYRGKTRSILNEYVKQEERSFTIIAFPTPDIGDKFEEIFESTIDLNTLDYQLYRECQQKLIDVLDQAEYIRVRGMGQNTTNIKVALHKLKDPVKESNFENCVADVNIPVGEVFTSPELKGTDGILHVPGVFLNGIRYHDLMLTFQDGVITDYTCKNFDDEEENRKLIREKLLFNHETLPLGEFAIGTNTTAYMAIKKYGIEDCVPILIAEKTGPHFAIGDTCYCREEDVVSYNPDGKKLVAKENAYSRLRETDPGKAYFQCHTDITIPYDELWEVTAVLENGKEIPIISDKRFVLKGLEELNKPFDE